MSICQHIVLCHFRNWGRRVYLLYFTAFDLMRTQPNPLVWVSKSKTDGRTKSMSFREVYCIYMYWSPCFKCCCCVVSYVQNLFKIFPLSVPLPDFHTHCFQFVCGTTLVWLALALSPFSPLSPFLSVVKMTTVDSLHKLSKDRWTNHLKPFEFNQGYPLRI